LRREFQRHDLLGIAGEGNRFRRDRLVTEFEDNVRRFVFQTLRAHPDRDRGFVLNET
jgi:hypothetical protein